MAECTSDNRITLVIQTSPSFSVSTPGLLFERTFADFEVARGGRILLVETPEPSASAGWMNVVVNWFGEIRRKQRQTHSRSRQA